MVFIIPLILKMLGSLGGMMGGGGAAATAGGSSAIGGMGNISSLFPEASGGVAGQAPYFVAKPQAAGGGDGGVTNMLGQLGERMAQSPRRDIDPRALYKDRHPGQAGGGVTILPEDVNDKAAELMGIASLLGAITGPFKPGMSMIKGKGR